MSRLGFYSSGALILVSILLNSTPSETSPGGAPLAACVTMTPQHNTNPQTSQSPYALQVARLSPDTLSVAIVPTAGAPFKGFLIQARRDGSDVPIGMFEGALPENTKTLACDNPSDSVTHSLNNTKTGVSFTWRSPGGSLVGSRFVATTCLDFITYWVKYTSIDLGDV